MKVLIVEDDERTSSFVAKGLVQAGFVVERAGDGLSGLEMALLEPFDAAVVDIMLPKMDGLTLIRNLRSREVLTPAIILSARHTVDDRINGLEAGGDDYLIKPFAFSELLARIQALIRRASSIPEPTSLTVKDLSIDLIRRKVQRGGQDIQLQPKEFALLEYLLRNVGRVVSKTMIMEHVWGYNFDPQTNVVEVRICRLREKIDRPFEDQRIRTVHGFGYVIE
ncbi:MAG: response regulator transcription factor [Verrucomicrobiota bacterium]|nr:response regulator transcription factor [Verrucomicrobiota bacterium]